MGTSLPIRPKSRLHGIPALAMALLMSLAGGSEGSAMAGQTESAPTDPFAGGILFQPGNGAPPSSGAGRGTTEAEARFKELSEQADKAMGTPAATVPLLELNGIAGELPEIAPLAHLYQKHCGQRKGDVRVKELACALQARAEFLRGRTAKANDILDALGTTTEFQVLGPFDNEGKSGCGGTLEPETLVDLSKEYKGKERAVRWRKLPEGRPFMGRVNLSSLFTPSAEVLGYAYAELVAEKDLEAILSLGVAGAVQVYLDGVRVVDDSRYHLTGFEQVRLQMKLPQGRHQLLLKLCGGGHAPGFRASVKDASGKAHPYLKVEASTLEGLRTLEEAVQPRDQGKKAGKAANKAQAIRLDTLADALRPKGYLTASEEKAAEDASKAKEAKPGKAPALDAKALRDFAVAANAYEPDDETDKTPATAGARATEAAPDDLESLKVAARFADKWEDSQRLLNAMLEKDPGNAWASARLAARLAGHGQPRRAMDVLEAALQRHPHEYSLSLVKATLLRSAFGMAPASERLLSSLLSAWPDRMDVLERNADFQDFMSRPAASAALRRTLLSLNHVDLSNRRSLASTLADMGDVDGALAERRRIVELAPWNTSDWLTLARVAGMNGSTQEALDALDRAIAIDPDSADVHERAGRLLASMGQREKALNELGRALELKPQNASLKDAMRSLSQAPAAKGFGEDLSVSVGELMAAHPPREGEDVQTLQQLTATQVHPNGLASRYVRTVARAQTRHGVEMLRQQAMAYAPGRQSLKLLAARIHRQDGTSSESYRQSRVSLSDEGTSMYHDVKATVVRFPSMEPGDVLEIAWRLDDVARDNLLSDYFGDVQALRTEAFKERFLYAVRMPPGRKLFSSFPEGLGVQASSANSDDGGTVYTFSATGIPRVVPEPSMPGSHEVAGVLHVSTYENWEDVGRYYAGLVRDQLAVTDRIKETLSGIVKDLPDPKDRMAVVKAVYDFTVSRTRYVALEFGIHSFKPYPADKVLARKFGDCKDKASLMHVLLKAAGIDSSLVLLRMNRHGAIGDYPASLAVFDHAILYVPEFDLFLDGTAEHHGSLELPIQDTGAQALVVAMDGQSRFTRVPLADPSRNIGRSDFDIQVAPDGSAMVTGTISNEGQQAPALRRLYQAEATRSRVFKQANEHLFPGLSLEALDVNGADDIESPFVLSFSFQSKRFGQLGSHGKIRLRPFGSSRRTHGEVMAPLAKRTLPLAIHLAYAKVWEARIRVPEGYSAESLPKPLAIETPRISFRMTATREADGSLRFHSSFTVKAHRVEPEDYPAFREELLRVDEALGTPLDLVPSPGR